MKKHPNDDLLCSLRAAQRRLRMQWFLERFVSLALCAGFVLIALAAVQRWVLKGALPAPVWWLAGPVLAGAAALLVALLRRLEWRDTAALLDRLGGTHDRLLTALAFAESPTPFQSLAVEECRAFLARKNLARLVPIRLPPAALFLLVPLFTLALLHWESLLTGDARRRAAEAAQTEAAPTAQRLEALARQLEKSAEAANDDQLKKLAEQLRKSAQQLRAQDNGAEEAARTALRELSNLERMLAQMQQPPASATPEEMKHLAEGLEKNDSTKAAAEAMKAGDLSKAAQELEEAAKQPTKEQSEKTLREAVERLARQRELSEAMQQLARQLQQGEGGPSSEALQKLAQMLRQMGRQQEGQPGKQPSAQMLKNLLAALENMKFGEGQQPEGDPQSSGDGDGQLTVQSFAKRPPGDSSPGGISQIPAGQPGGERDPGTTETPFGQKSGDSPDQGREGALKGRLAEGESLSQLLPSAGDTSKSSRRYKELFDAMAPAAEEAVVQENIPLGSRFLIKRYFESIRPQQ